MNCSNCKFCVEADHGYSNYTVEGTNVYCGSPLKEIRKKFVSFDRFYGKASEYSQGENCKSFEEGSPVGVDVENDYIKDFSDEEREIYDRAME